MHHAVMSRVGDADIVVMAAAVADFTPAAPVSRKIAKGESLDLTLTKTRDVLADLGALSSRQSAERPLLVGFAAETHAVLDHARDKLTRKAVDLIVANDVSLPDAGFETDTNAVTLVSRDGVEEVPLQSKTSVAMRILDRIERLLSTRSTTVPTV
jgi:phosphopantothenoylcysteine decarboxylase/phosphopantothenate--cysteine ligase